MFNSKTPALLPNAALKGAGHALGLRDATAERFLSRLPNVGWFAATLLAVYLLGRRTVGAVAASLATIATALDPNWIAHGSVATTDAPYGCATVLFLAAGIAFARRPGWGRAVLLGLALGFAFTAKFTAFLLLPGLLLLPLATDDPGRFRSQLGTLVVRLSATIAVAWLLVSGSYLFTRMAAPLSASRWRSSFMKDLAERHPDLRLPAPADFLTGVDMCVAHERGRGWPVMLFGRRYPDGVWYYFLVLWALKTPVLMLLAQGLGLFRAARDRLLAGDPALRYIALNLLLTLVYFSFFFRAQIGYRYVLMCLPLGYLLAAGGLARWQRPWLLAAGGVVVAATVAENAMYLGNPLAFTNAAVWPKRQVFRLINDSNLGWGQNRMKIQGWLQERSLAGSHLDPLHVLEGHNTFDVNVVSGLVQFERHRWLRENARPGGHLGHTHVWFDVSHEMYERFLNETRRHPPLPEPSALCPAAAPYSPVVSGPGTGSDASLALSDRGAAWIVCVRADGVVDLGLSVTEATAELGRIDEARPDWETIERRQVAWHRLEPGFHAFGAAGPWQLQAHWETSGGGAAIHIRPADLDQEGLAHPAVLP